MFWSISVSKSRCVCHKLYCSDLDWRTVNTSGAKLNTWGLFQPQNKDEQTRQWRPDEDTKEPLTVCRKEDCSLIPAALTSTVIMITSWYAFSSLLPQQQAPPLTLLNLHMKLYKWRSVSHSSVTSCYRLCLNITAIIFHVFLTEIVHRCQPEGKRIVERKRKWTPLTPLVFIMLISYIHLLITPSLMIAWSPFPTTQFYHMLCISFDLLKRLGEVFLLLFFQTSFL